MFPSMDELSESCYCYASNNIKSLYTNTTKCSNTLKQLVDNLPTNCLSVFDHFVELELNGLSVIKKGQLFSNFYDYFHYQNIYETKQIKRLINKIVTVINDNTII